MTATHASEAAPSGFRLAPFLWRSIMLGVLIGLFAGPVAAVIVSMASLLTTGQPGFDGLVPPPLIVLTMDLQTTLLLMLVVAPLLESLVLPPIHLLLKRLPIGRALFVVVIGVLAFLAHGMRPVNLVQAFGFMLLAAWYAHLATRHPSPRLLSPVKIPYFGVVIAHAAWNATLVLAPFAITLLLSILKGLAPAA